MRWRVSSRVSDGIVSKQMQHTGQTSSPLTPDMTPDVLSGSNIALEGENTPLSDPDRTISEASLASDIRQLADEAKAMAVAELAFQKSRAAFVGAESRAIVGLLVVAAVVLFFTAMAAIIGTVIALGAWIGPWWAMLVVTLVLGVIAVICALSAKSRVKRMLTVLGKGQKS